MSSSRQQVVVNGATEGAQPWADAASARMAGKAGAQMPTGYRIEGSDLPLTVAGESDVSNGVGQGSLDKGFSDRTRDLDEVEMMDDSGGFAGRPDGWER